MEKVGSRKEGQGQASSHWNWILRGVGGLCRQGGHVEGVKPQRRCEAAGEGAGAMWRPESHAVVVRVCGVGGLGSCKQS
eukprot:364760-Chlamydomonas_euryale.AAC.5